jgi:hypothetical protein
MKIVIKQVELQRLMSEFAARTIRQSFESHSPYSPYPVVQTPEAKVTFSGDPQDGSLTVTLEVDPPRKTHG